MPVKRDATRVLLVQNIAAEQLGVLSIAAAARGERRRLRLAYGRDRRILRLARDFRPDVVGFSVMTGFQGRWIRLARAIKEAAERPPLVVFGGPHATFFPQVVQEEGVDVAVRGEAEGAFTDLLTAFESGERRFAGIPNVVVQEGDTWVETPMRPLVALDELPFPDREIAYEDRFIRNDPCARLAAGRGCPFSCSFCYAERMRRSCRGLGPFCRLRSTESLLEEIDQVHTRWGKQSLSFVDDTFSVDRRWVLDFLDRYARRFRLPFFCQMRADQISEELARALKDAGCHLVSFGLESGVERIRNQVLDKNLSDETIRTAADRLRRVGLPFETTNMMGLPGERPDDAVRTVQLNIEIGSAVAWTSLYQPYPGTDLGERTLRDGLIDRFPDDAELANAHTGSALRQPGIEEIVRLHKFVYLAIRFPATLPWIRKLMKRDWRRLYLIIHRLTYFRYAFCRERIMNWRRTVAEAVAAWRHY